MYMKKNVKGFTVVELIVSIAILGVLAAVSVRSFANFSHEKGLTVSATVLAQSIRDARSRTLASVDASQYGIKIDADRFTLFKGNTFSSSTPGNEIVMFPGSVMASTTIQTILFARVTGYSSASGTIDLYLPETFGGNKKTLLIESTGLVSIQ